MEKETWKERNGKRDMEREKLKERYQVFKLWNVGQENREYTICYFPVIYKLIKWANNNNYVEKCEYFNHILNGLIKT